MYTENQSATPYVIIRVYKRLVNFSIPYQCNSNIYVYNTSVCVYTTSLKSDYSIYYRFYCFAVLRV